MDLAKIRQKARLEQEIRKQEVTSFSGPGITESTNEIDIFPSTDRAPIIPVADFNNELNAPPPAKSEAHPVYAQQFKPNVRDPLSVILAGRQAAGCGDDEPLASEAESRIDINEYLEYLCFRVSDEIYGINIMDIKEIIKPREVTEVPRAPAFVSGIISLRGIIIPIIDMRERLGLIRIKVTGRERVIVVKHNDSFSGLLVDEIIQVVHISKECLEPAPAVLEGIDRDFVNGIGRADGRMIILLNLENIADIHLF
jgi:purine-binding chemotaxis protein CheW